MGIRSLIKNMILEELVYFLEDEMDLEEMLDFLEDENDWRRRRRYRRRWGRRWRRRPTQKKHFQRLVKEAKKAKAKAEGIVRAAKAAIAKIVSETGLSTAQLDAKLKEFKAMESYKLNVANLERETKHVENNQKTIDKYASKC